MNRNRLLAATLSFVAGAALAQEASYDDPVRYDASLSRARVQSEALPAAVVGEGTPQQQLPSGYEKTRAEVQAELLEARRLGLMHAGEGSPREATEDERDAIRLAGLRARVQAGLIALLK